MASYGRDSKINDAEIKKFDASLDPSITTSYDNSKEYNNLKKKGFEIYIPYAEAFENIQGDKYPMAFIPNGVDEVTDIIHSYDDKYYDEFIDVANTIFNKYKENCNPDNKYLLLEADCPFEDDNDTEAHGGYLCNAQGKWDKSKCNKSYCNIGYYYDRVQDKCILDICTNDPNTIEVTLNDKYDKEITISQENNTKYIFTIDTNKYSYFFQASEPGFMHYDYNDPCPSYLCSLQGDSSKKVLYINIRKKANETVTFKIKSEENFPGYILSLTNGIRMIQPKI